MVPFHRRTRFFPGTVFVLGLFFATIPVGPSAKVWFLTASSSAPEPDETDSEETDDIDWLVDVLRRDPISKHLETAASDTASRAKTFDHSAEESGFEGDRVYTIDKGGAQKQHKEYHVHYHTHQHVLTRDRKFTDLPTTVKYNVHKPISNDFKPHLAGFKDFETLLKQNAEQKFYETSPSERYKRYRPRQLGILDSPGGSPKANENIPTLISRESRNISRFINKHYGNLQIPNLSPKLPVKLENLRKVGNMSGWLVYSWS